MPITYVTENVRLPRQFKRRIHTQWIQHIVQKHGSEVKAISFIFCNDERILEINRQYLKHDYYTDVITFDGSENHQLSGDIFISLETVKSNAQLYKTSYEEELRRVMIHGVLHLCGLKDKTLTEKKKMKKEEGEALQIFQDLTAK